VLALVFALPALLYARTSGHDWVAFDDPTYVLANPAVQALDGAGLRWAFTSFHAGNYHPLTWLSHMLDCALFGLAPRGPHLVNAGLHALNAVLCFLALRSLGIGSAATLWTALLFALHPQRVESVAWIAERKDLLAGAFFFLTLGAYARWTRAPSGRRYAWVLTAFALGLLSKPTLVTTPLVLLALDGWPLGRLGTARDLPRRVLEKLPLYALSAAAGAATLLAQAGAGATASNAGIPLALRVANACAALGDYARQTVWPRGLAALYPHPVLVSSDPWALVGPRAVAGAIGLAVASFAAVVLRRRRPWFVLGLAWFLLLLLPMLGLVQVGLQSHADRYTYLATIGLTLAAAGAAAELVRAWPRARAAVSAAAALVLLACVPLTWRQIGTWRTSRTLFERVLAVTERNAFAHDKLGSILIDEYVRTRDPATLQAAREQCEAAIAIAPGYALAHANLGAVLLEQGHASEALAELAPAAEAQPGPTVLRKLGDALRALGREEEARAAHERARTFAPPR
jgi:tetratricopeptide (TPR) repeat protein